MLLIHIDALFIGRERPSLLAAMCRLCGVFKCSFLAEKKET